MSLDTPGFKQAPCMGAGCEVIPYVHTDTDPAATLCHGCKCRQARETKTMTTIEDTTITTEHANGITEAPKRTRKARATMPPPETHGAVSAVQTSIAALVAERDAARKLADSLDLEVRNVLSTLTTMAGPGSTPVGHAYVRLAVSKPEIARAHKPAPQGQGGTAREGRRARLARRSAEDIEHGVERVVSLLKSSESGLRAEQIRGNLSLTAKEMPRLLKAALASKLLTRKGSKRATTYTAR
jgi:hypothetical protein